MNELKLVARGAGNWDYYLSVPYSDGSQAVLAIAKPGSGAGNSHFCGVSRLRAHLFRLRQICGYENLIPEDWEVVDEDFFEKLGIL